MNTNKPLSILILPLLFPYPPNDGGKICIYGFVDYLRRYHDFTLIIPLNNSNQVLPAESLQKEWPNVNLKFVELFDSSLLAASEVKLQSGKDNIIIRILRRLLSIIRKVGGSKNENAAPIYTPLKEEKDLLDESYFTFPFSPHQKKYISAMKKVLEDSSYDIIHVCLTRNLNLIHALPDGPVKIFEEIESRFEVIKDYSQVNKNDLFFSDYIIKNCEYFENMLMSKYDAIFALNEKDKLYLKNKMPLLNIYHSPFGILDKDIKFKATTNIESPEKMVFSGNEIHYPNYDAVLWYIKEIHKNSHFLNRLDLYITGEWSESTINKLKNDNIHFVGLVDSYPEFLKRSIMIVPIRIGGGGLRTKILYAMGNGIPVISTSIAAVGTEFINNKNILIADEPDAFCRAIKKLMDDANLRVLLIDNAHKLITEKYSQTSTSELRNRHYYDAVTKKGSPSLDNVSTTLI